MYKQFFIRDNGKEVGPYTLEQLKDKHISSDIYVWSQGMKEWERAKKAVPELFKEVIPPPFRGENESVPPGKKMILLLIIAVGFIFILTIFIYRKKDSISTTSNGIENTGGIGEKKNFQSEETRAAAVKIRNSIPSQVSVEIVSFKHRWFGKGIKGLSITVKNRSAYTLDSIVTEVVVKKDAGEIAEKFQISSSKLKPGESVVLEGEKTSSGSTPELRVASIYSKEIKLCYTQAARNQAGKVEDPYLCAR